MPRFCGDVRRDTSFGGGANPRMYRLRLPGSDGSARAGTRPPERTARGLGSRGLQTTRHRRTPHQPVEDLAGSGNPLREGCRDLRTGPRIAGNLLSGPPTDPSKRLAGSVPRLLVGVLTRHPRCDRAEVTAVNLAAAPPGPPQVGRGLGHGAPGEVVIHPPGADLSSHSGCDSRRVHRALCHSTDRTDSARTAAIGLRPRIPPPATCRISAGLTADATRSVGEVPLSAAGHSSSDGSGRSRPGACADTEPIQIR